MNPIQISNNEDLIPYGTREVMLAIQNRDYDFIIRKYTPSKTFLTRVGMDFEYDREFSDNMVNSIRESREENNTNILTYSDLMKIMPNSSIWLNIEGYPINMSTAPYIFLRDMQKRNIKEEIYYFTSMCLKKYCMVMCICDRVVDDVDSGCMLCFGIKKVETFTKLCKSFT